MFSRDGGAVISSPERVSADAVSRHRKMRYHEQAHFDKGARLVGFASVLVYVLLGIVMVDYLIAALVRL